MFDSCWVGGNDHPHFRPCPGQQITFYMTFFKMNLKHVLMAFLILFISCSEEKQEECIGYRPGFVTDVNAPSSGKVNTPIEIEVDFPVYNGCGNFGEFLESGSNFLRVIEVRARYEGCMCTQNIPIRTTIYSFIPKVAGEYVLKFKSGEEEFSVVNLMITG